MLAARAASALRAARHHPALLAARAPPPAAASAWHMRPQARGVGSRAAAGGAGDTGAAAAAAEVQPMSVQELQELLANPVLCEECQFIDVREQGEYDVARLPHFKLLPLSEASSWAPTVHEDLDPSAETVVLCHHGMRSMNAAMFLVSRGFQNVKNVTGGIDAYSRVDGSVPRY